MLERLLKKQRPRVFLGGITVADRTDLKRYLEQEGDFENEPLDSALHRSLVEIFSLPLAECVGKPLDTDLVLDVWIPKYQSGEFVDVHLWEAGVTLFWRPRVTVASRLSSLVTKKTKATFSVTERMKWRHFLGRMFSWRGLFRLQPFVREDMEFLLYQACLKLWAKMRKAV